MKVFSGIRPSGQLHLGNYFGAIHNWLTLQDQHDCLFAVVDYHALTTPFDPATLKTQIRDVILDYLAVGLDPKKCRLIVQSHVPEHTELAWILASISPLSWFERVPTYKEKAAQHAKHLTLGLLSYPALMAADILIYKAELVPVGEDQLPHIELTNQIGERFNHLFGDTFPPVKALVQKEGARLMSLKDPSKKMSKTGDEGIALTDTPDAITRKIKKAVTDSGDEIRSGKNKPAMTNLLTVFSLVTGESIKSLEKKYDGQGYAVFKTDLATAIIDFLRPIQAKRATLANDPALIDTILKESADQARAMAQTTLTEVKTKLGVL